MKIIRPVDIKEIREHEVKTKANVIIGGYNMDIYCPISEFVSFWVMLEEADWDRLFLISQFAQYTHGNTGKVIHARELSEKTESTVALYSSMQSVCPALLIVSANIETASLIIIDGNHRAIAQYRKQKGSNIPAAYVCIHPNINKWGYVPKGARVFLPETTGTAQ